MSDEKFIDYYALLGVSFKATPQQIDESYKKVLEQTKAAPDNKPSLVQLAYAVLSDEEKRKNYNESYIRLQLGIDPTIAYDAEASEDIADYIKEDADGLLEKTRTRLKEFDMFVSEQLSNKNADKQFKEQAVDKAETLYKRGMWPLLEKLKNLVGESSPIYYTSCELHSKAILSLGDLCMWAARYERAIGMYNTALALSANNMELAIRCAKSVELAKLAFDEERLSSISSTAELQAIEKDEIYLPYFSIATFVLIGLFFSMFCLWSVLILLDTIFLV